MKERNLVYLTDKEQVNNWTVRKILNQHHLKSWRGLNQDGMFLIQEDVDNQRMDLDLIKPLVETLEDDIASKKYKFKSFETRAKHRWVVTKVRNFYDAKCLQQKALNQEKSTKSPEEPEPER